MFQAKLQVSFVAYLVDRSFVVCITAPNCLHNQLPILLRMLFQKHVEANQIHLQIILQLSTAFGMLTLACLAQVTHFTQAAFKAKRNANQCIRKQSSNLQSYKSDISPQKFRLALELANFSTHHFKYSTGTMCVTANHLPVLSLFLYFTNSNGPFTFQLTPCLADTKTLKALLSY